VRQITEYQQRGMPREQDGRYCVEDCQAWLAANIKPTGRNDDKPDPSERAQWETHLTRERALLAELERREKEGQLLDVDLLARRDEQRITHAKELLLQIPDRAMGLLPRGTSAKARRDFRDRLVEMIEDTLHALAELEVEVLSEDGDDGGTPEPPGADPRA
jgi:phage terminase Nu1 subunit (DNA packaging protein)